MKNLLIALIMTTMHGLNGQSIRDDFTTEKSLENWQLLEIEGWQSKLRDIKVRNEQLMLEPTSSGWFEDNIAAHIYREYDGDFELTTRVKVEGVNSTLPETAFSLAGLFIRVPRELSADNWERGKENWMFFSVGSATEPGKSQFEIKSTYNSQSTLKVYPAKNKWMELKIVRVSEIFSLLYRYQDEGWILLDQFIRPDLPSELQLGITAYSDWPSLAELYPNYEAYNKQGVAEDKGDLKAYFDYISIGPTPVKKDLPIANLIGDQVLQSLTKTGE